MRHDAPALRIRTVEMPTLTDAQYSFPHPLKQWCLSIILRSNPATFRNHSRLSIHAVFKSTIACRSSNICNIITQCHSCQVGKFIRLQFFINLQNKNTHILRNQ
ncbi:uncharacterized protein LOC122506470 [Leptopilina heterotoma]|uniref:uncharacterized protein LOC122506470 n=1 Tax=Leptopilina heterotoma TaxID=63436 RepID=UPI001CAA2741|nr:uncharacterized protein LOC122506470 [Leptopilina heterotoma]